MSPQSNNPFVFIIENLFIYTNRRVITRAEAQLFADENSLNYVETSAKSAEGVDEAFMRTAECVWEKQRTGGLDRKHTINEEVLSIERFIIMNTINRKTL